MLTKTLCKKWVLLFTPLMAMIAGCLSPATIRPVANQNSQNISNYNANVAATANALRHEASFHGELVIQIARNKVAGDLMELPKKWLGSPTPTSHNLADPSKEPYISLKNSVEVARGYRTEISNVLENEEAIDAAMVAKFPLVPDLFPIPGSSPHRIQYSGLKQPLRGHLSEGCAAVP